MAGSTSHRSGRRQGCSIPPFFFSLLFLSPSLSLSYRPPNPLSLSLSLSPSSSRAMSPPPQPSGCRPPLLKALRGFWFFCFLPTWCILLVAVCAPCLARTEDLSMQDVWQNHNRPPMENDSFFFVKVPSALATICKGQRRVEEEQPVLLPRGSGGCVGGGVRLRMLPPMQGYSSVDGGYPQSATEESSSISCISSSLSGKLSKQMCIETFPLPLIAGKQHWMVKDSLTAAPKVAIEPPFLHWGSHQPLYTPATAILTIMNLCHSSQLHVFDPFSTNPQFYVSAFHKIIVPPRSAVSVPVVFLPWIEGSIEGLLVMQTNEGGFVVHVQGIGIASPFKLKPLGVLNSAPGVPIHHSISLFNPYNQPLVVKEAYARFDECINGMLVYLGPEAIDEVGVHCKNNSSISTDIQSNVVGQGQHVTLRFSEHSNVKIQLTAVGKWVIDPHCSGSIVELQVSTDEVKELTGSLWLKVSSEVHDILIIPLKITFSKVHNGGSKSHTVSEVLDFGFINEELERKLIIALSNPGPDPLLVERVSLSPDDSGIIKINMLPGTILYPQARTKVASATYLGFQQKAPPVVNKECDSTILHIRSKIFVQTNSSVYPVIEIPYKALISGCAIDSVSSKTSSVVLEKEADLVKELWDLYSQSGLQNAINVPLVVFQSLLHSACRAKLEVDSESRIIAHHFSGSETIIRARELVFPMVHVGLQEFQWVTVSNPSETPVLMQLLVSPEAGASKCRLCKCNSLSSECDLESNFSSPEAEDDSSVGRVHTGVFTIGENGVVDVIVQPKSTAALGPIIFRPPERCLWTSLLAVRNNLTQLEWIPLHGLGAFMGLTVLDGDVPAQVLQLDYNEVGFSLPMRKSIIHRLFELFLSNDTKSVCADRMHKDYVAKNTGDLPLQVEARLLNGSVFDSGSFNLGPSHLFHLEPGETATLSVSFRPDFTVAYVERELHLVTSYGMTLVKPLRATLPEHLLPACREALLISRTDKLLTGVGLILVMATIAIFVRVLKQRRQMASRNLNGYSLLLSSINPRSGSKAASGHNSHGTQRSFSQAKVERVEKSMNEGVKTMKKGVLSTMQDYAISKKTSSAFQDQDISPEIKVKISRVQGPSPLSKSSTRSGEGKTSAIPLKASQILSLSEEDCAKLLQEQLSTRTGFPNKAVGEKVKLPLSCDSNSQSIHLHPPGKMAAMEKREKTKRKKKRSIISDSKPEVETGFASNSSSPLSSPASSMTPAEGSRPVSPLVSSEISPSLRAAIDPMTSPTGWRTLGSKARKPDGSKSVDGSPKSLSLSGSQFSQKDVEFVGGNSPKEDATLAGHSQNTNAMVELGQRSHESVVATGKAMGESGNCMRKAVLTNSATFPQGGWKSMWNGPPIDGMLLADLSMPTTSGVSPSAISPNARAPGSRLTKQTANGNPSGSEEPVYDIWGDHFAEINRASYFAPTNLPTLPTNLQSLFARSEFIVQPGNLSNSSHPGSPFSTNADSLFSSLFPGSLPAVDATKLPLE